MAVEDKSLVQWRRPMPERSCLSAIKSSLVVPCFGLQLCRAYSESLGHMGTIANSRKDRDGGCAAEDNGVEERRVK